ncbi:MAG: 2-dehydropantoate 2-reductase [Candidatus Lernaella stagnicola]|nr:2-dehydropantoate 2-reductase [Candidatus Lernaella stagnicola]
MKIDEHSKVLFFGAGAIGASVGGWLSGRFANVYFYDKPEIRDVLGDKGITMYWGETPQEPCTVRARTIDDLRDAADARIVAIAVKNYSLEPVAKMIREAIGDNAIVIGLQNGVENQKILPRYFSRVVYCIVSYNAWLDETGVVGYQKHGPLVLGTLHNELMPEMKNIAKLWSHAVETVVTKRFQDAAHCKLIINLANSLTTLIGHRYREISDRALFQKVLTNMTWEGVQIARAAGYSESKLGGMPPWKLLWAGSHLPRFLTGRMFEKNVKKMVISSMAQDVLQRRQGESELETINGYLLDLAREHGVVTPYNRVVYELCRKKFAEPDFQPMDITEVWHEIELIL